MSKHIEMVIFLIVDSMMFIVGAIHIRAWAKRTAAAKKEQDARENEKRRIANLPKLNTQNLMQAPDDFVNTYYKGAAPGTFGNRYGTMLVVDREDKVWMGFFSSVTLISMALSEYDQASLWIPQVGPGEAHSAPPFIVDGERYSVYPMFIKTEEQRRRWHQLYQNYLQEFANKDPHEAFHTCYREIRESKKKERLAA